MSEQSKNPQPGHAARAYPLAELTRTLPPLTAFQAFVAAAELGSFSRAADHLCRTQGAVSRQVQQLEVHYGCALFVRHASGLTLTAEGGALLTVAVDVLTQLARHAEAHGDVAPVLTLRLPSTFAIRWLLPRLPAINRALRRPSCGSRRRRTTRRISPEPTSTRSSYEAPGTGPAWCRFRSLQSG